MSSGIIKTEVARSVPFDNSTNGMESSNVQEAIEEIEVKSGFHFKVIRVGKRVTIPEDMQMTVKQHLKVYGQIIVRGELVIL